MIGWSVFSVDEEDWTPEIGYRTEVLAGYAWISCKYFHICVNVIIKTPINSDKSRITGTHWMIDLPFYKNY